MGDNDNTKAPAERVSPAAAIFGGAALITVLLANTGVLARYVLQLSLPSVEEILRYIFIWLIFICSALSYKDGTLISITMLEDHLKSRPKLRRALQIIQNLAVLIFALVSLWTGWEMMMTQFEFEELSVVLEINMGWITLGVVIGYALLSWFALCNLLRGWYDPNEFISTLSTRIRRSFRGNKY